MQDISAAFARARVLVCGDIMLDRYWHGTTSRISPEAPVPVVRVEQTEDRPGGAANVALNAAVLGARVRLAGVVGEDATAGSLEALLSARGVACDFQREPGFATITKLRVLSQHQQLIRCDFEGPAERTPALSPLRVPGEEPEPVVVLSDYAKGALASARLLIEAACALSARVVVDPKGTGFSRYAGAHVITPNQREFEAEVGQAVDDTTLIEAAVELCRRHRFGAVLVTRGERGMTLVERHGAARHLHTEARDVFDVTGAGDTVCAVLATALAAGFGLYEATRFANAAAGVVVGKLGTASVSVLELQQALNGSHLGSGVVDRERLLREVAAARAQGARIVMTNGCFDVLHPGHVAYLEEARRLGDRLIVAVNDDASVTRLKGDSRPVNPLAARMAVLAGLAAVDWVVPFSGPTPAGLIAEVRPDVLVKGGDYRPEQIAGHDAVVAAGGEVRVLGFVPGHSTSAVIARIRGPEDAP
jgi:D-beta-D-heptose 7-phosphate kinase/D-beta-D-heptose 1-phosphate adenosyltransferase